MIRIIHISDLHLESENPAYEKIKIINALSNDLKTFVDQFTILIFTGDLIDKGGIKFENRDLAFKKFEEFFIDKVVAANPFLKGKVFVIPGNQDVFRDKIDPYSEIGLKEKLIDQKNLTEFIQSNKENSKHLDRITNYKVWEKEFYSNSSNSQITNFDSTFIVTVKNYKIGISCFNSAWMCKDDNDKENILLGKEQIEHSLNYMGDCNIKLALCHHPMEFFNQFDRDPSKISIYKNYDILFTGHVHELGSSYTQDLFGNIFISIANSTIGDFPTERRFVNGYTIIDLYPNEKIIATYRKYIEDHDLFVPNTDIGTEDGKKTFVILKDDKLEKFEINQAIVSSIESRFADKLNDDIIMADNTTNASCSIDALFVEPRLLNCPQASFKEEDTIEYSIESLLHDTSNYLIYGLKESGKTIFLDKMFLDSVRRFNQFNVIPVLLKFSDIKKGDIVKVLREYLSISSNEIDKFLSDNRVLIFIDDIQFNEKTVKQIDGLKKLIQNYKLIRLIASSDQLTENDIPTDYLDHNDVFNFNITFIQNFNSNEIKQLVTKWFVGKEVDLKDNMQKLIKSFVDFGLPKTPLSITLFLWIFETQEGRPVNNSVLVELFIENLLEKTKFENIYSETFDFTNKKRLLSFISKFMRDNGDDDLSYSVDYVILLNFIKEYLRTRFTGQPQKVLDDFIRRGILTYEDDNLIRFKSAFFFHYFLALHFDYDANFKSLVFSGDNFFDYMEEINYYTGLKRDDLYILNFTQEKLYEAFGVFNEDIRLNFKKVDATLEAKKAEGTITYQLNEVKAEDKLSDKQLDKIYDENLSSIPVQKSIVKKQSSNKTFDSVLKLASNVLKNSEDVDDYDAKKAAYSNILLSSISFLMQYRDSLIVYYQKYQEKPQSLPKNIDFNLFIQVMPLFHQVVMYEWLGSQKLRPVLLDKMESDKLVLNMSEYEKSLSVFIYSDIKGSDYPDVIRNFVKATSYNYLKDLSFLKLFSYFHLRSNTKELDEFYLKLMSEIREDLGKIHKTAKDQFKKGLKEMKEKRSN